MFTKTEDKLQ